MAHAHNTHFLRRRPPDCRSPTCSFGVAAIFVSVGIAAFSARSRRARSVCIRDTGDPAGCALQMQSENEERYKAIYSIVSDAMCARLHIANWVTAQ